MFRTPYVTLYDSCDYFVIVYDQQHGQMSILNISHFFKSVCKSQGRFGTVFAKALGLQKLLILSPTSQHAMHDQRLR